MRIEEYQKIKNEIGEEEKKLVIAENKLNELIEKYKITKDNFTFFEKELENIRMKLSEKIKEILNIEEKIKGIYNARNN